MMRLQDLSNYIEIDMAEALEERFMDSEELYVRFLRKLEAANDWAVVEALVAQRNWPEALRKAHNLKGVCGSLGLTKLQAQLAALVKLLRSEGFTAEQVEAALKAVRPEWERTLRLIRQLED
ncbi:MAG: Hpt domain-containing protein [Phascolarctobacterium sp.]